MDLKQFKELKINGHQMASLSIGGVVIWSKGVEPVEDWKLDEDGYLIGADGKYYERWYDDSHAVDNNPIADLNGEWVEDTVSGGLNIDKNFDYFMSNSNYNIGNSYAQFKVYWSGLTHVDFLYRSYGESSYDYLVINGLDKDKFTSQPSYATSGILAHTYGKPTTTYNTLSIDCDKGEHFIWFCYRKDGSVDRDSDRAFIGVPNNYKSGEIFEKQGEELHYEYVESSDFIIPREGYLQYKYYKTYFSPNGLNSFTTDEYVLGEEVPATPITENYLRFDATTNDVHIGFEHLDVVKDMEYSVGFKETFKPFTSDGVDIAQGKSIWLRASGIKDDFTAKCFTTSDLVECHGDVRSLLNKTNFDNASLTSKCFAYLFKKTKITTIPELKVSELRPHCYLSMFSECKEITIIPTLPPLIGLDQSCERMFYGCEKLTTVPYLDLSITSSYGSKATSSFAYMFGDCKSLTIVNGKLSSVYVGTCQNMFYRCTSLISGIDLIPTTINATSYQYMFYGCTNLESIKCNAIKFDNGTTITDSIGSNFCASITTNGTFYKNPEWDGPTARGNHTIPTNWTIVDWTDAA